VTDAGPVGCSFSKQSRLIALDTSDTRVVLQRRNYALAVLASRRFSETFGLVAKKNPAAVTRAGSSCRS